MPQVMDVLCLSKHDGLKLSGRQSPHSLCKRCFLSAVKSRGLRWIIVMNCQLWVTDFCLW